MSDTTDVTVATAAVIKKCIVRENEPVLYYLNGSKRGFVREEFMIIPKGTELLPEKSS